MWIYLRQRLLQLRDSKAGATLVYFALTLPIFVSFAGLGFDATLWFMEKRQLQTVVDSSAIAAAYSLSKDDNFQVFFMGKGKGKDKNFDVVLKKGETYAFRLDFVDHGRTARCKLRWSSPSIKRQIIPPQYLFHLDPEADK